jgi:hypothetical protein
MEMQLGSEKLSLAFSSQPRECGYAENTPPTPVYSHKSITC